MPQYKLVVLTNCRGGADAEFNRWYDDVHLPDLLAVSGFTAASRMRIVEDPAAPPASHRYCAIYEISSDEIEATMANMMSRAGTERMMLSDTMLDDVQMNLWQVITPTRSSSVVIP